MTSHLTDKVVVITGAAGGFGRLVAQGAAALGAKVVAADIDGDGVSALAVELSSGAAVLGCACDVTKLSDMQGLVEQAQQEFGAVDVMINNAGVMPLAFYADHKAAQAAWDRCIDINFKGVLHGMTAVYDTMISQGRGHIVNLSSIYSHFPVAGAGVYGATKAAVNFLSESMRVEAQGKIKVTVVKPTGVPATGLAAGVVNPQAVVGILGQNAASYGQLMAAYQMGELPAEHTDERHIEYVSLAPQYLADQILYAINQPWGVVIGDITVRASGEGYIL